MFEWLRSKKSDLILMQETHSIASDENVWREEWGGDVYFSHGDRDSKGVMTLVNKQSNLKVLECKRDDSGRTLILRIDMYGAEILVVNIYAPNADEADFYECLFTDIASYNATNVLVAGDYNLVLDIDLDKSGGQRRTNNKSQQCVLRQMEVLDLCDIWRIKNPSTREYIWRRRKPSLIQCRLDFILVSDSIVNMVSESSIGGSFMSDHSPVYMTLRFDEI
jgi:exonuclease III